MAIQATNYDGTKEYSVAEMGDLCNDNLLINSDFRYGIINQKGQTSYTENGSYTIDMWQISGNCGVVIKDGSIQFYKGSGTAKLRQLFNSKPLSGDFTFTVRLISGTSSNRMYIQNSAGKITDKVIPIGQDVTMNYSGDIQEIGILSSEENGSCYISFMKLEKGSFFTGMPTWNYEDELFKCQHRYYRISKTFGNAIKLSNGLVYIFMNIPVPMSGKGSVSVGSIDLTGNGSRFSATISELSVLTQDNVDVVLTCKVSQSMGNNISYTAEINNFSIDTNNY